MTKQNKSDKSTKALNATNVASVLDSFDPNGVYGLYKLNSGAFVIADPDLANGQPATGAIRLVSNSKGTAWTTKATRAGIVVGTDPDGNEMLGLVTAMGSGAKGVYTGQNFLVNGETATLIGKSATLAFQHALAVEPLMNQDLTGDDVIGDEILEVIDLADGYDEFAGLYRMKSGAHVIAEAGLSEGSSPTTLANSVLSAKDGKVWMTKSKALAITPVWANDDETVVEWGVITSTGIGTATKYFEEVFRQDWIYDPIRAISKGKAVQLTTSQILFKELFYKEDFNKDGVLGDAITFVVDESDVTETYGLYKMASGAFAVSSAGLQEKNAPQELGLGLATLMADAKGKLWSTKATPLALNAQTNAKTGADELTVISRMGSGAKAVYAEELFTVSTDQTRATLTGKAVTLTSLALAQKETLYDEDLDLDGRIGSPVLFGSLPDQPHIIDSEESYHAVIVGADNARSVLEISGADAYLEIGIDPTDNTALMKSQQLYFSALSVAAPIKNMTMGTALISDGATVNIQGGLPIKGYKYSIPSDKTFAGLSAGHGKGTNGSLSIESAATVTLDSEFAYVGAGVGQGLGEINVSGAETGISILSDWHGFIEVGVGDRVMNWLGGKGSLNVSDSAYVDLKSQAGMGMSVGAVVGEGAVTLTDGSMNLEASKHFDLWIGMDTGKGLMSLDNSAVNASAASMNLNLGGSGGTGKLELENSSASFTSLPQALGDWGGTWLTVGGSHGSKSSKATGEISLTNNSVLDLNGFRAGINLGSDAGNSGRMTVADGSKVQLKSSQAGADFVPRDKNNDWFSSNAGLSVGASWGSLGGTGILEISGAGTEFLMESLEDWGVSDVKEDVWINVGGNQGTGTLIVDSGAALMTRSDGNSGLNVGFDKAKGNFTVQDAVMQMSARNLGLNVGQRGGTGSLRFDNASVTFDSAPTASSDYDWSGTYVRIGGVEWDSNDKASVGEAVVTNAAQFNVVGSHAGVSIADGAGSRGKMVVDNGAQVVVSSTTLNNEYAPDQGPFSFLNVGGSWWESYGGQGWLEISGPGTTFRITSDAAEADAHAGISIGGHGESGLVVVNSGAVLQADGVASSSLSMSSEHDSKAKEGTSFLQISGQDSLVSINYVDAGLGNQAFIDVSDQGQLNSATINILRNGTLVGNAGVIASNDPAGNSSVIVDGRICVGDRLDLVKRTKTTAIGQLDVGGDVRINKIGRLEFDIGQSGADMFAVDGLLDIDGTVAVNSLIKLTKGAKYLIATANSIDLQGSTSVLTGGVVGVLQLEANATELYFVVS